MKRYFILMAIILGMVVPPVSAQSAKQKVAVYVTGEAESGQKKVIGSRMVSSITRSDSYAAVERTADFLAALTKEQDYQMSGAVSDNQIVRLGQQFGVRYVLVADISEVYESMFISARMIDVQTGQITGASEASSVVNSMDGLIDLSDTVISELLGGIIYGEYKANNRIEDIKLIGPFAGIDILSYHTKIPEGYHVATKDDLEKLIKTYKKSNRSIAFPIYSEIQIEDYGKNQFYLSSLLFKNENEVRELNSVYIWYSSDDGWRNLSSILTGYIYLIKN